jgi:hypothetical protein
VIGVAALSLPSAVPNSSFPLPAPRGPSSAWVALRGRRGRLKRYADAMGWQLSSSGVLAGDVEGIEIVAYEDRTHVAVIELVAPAVLPRMEIGVRRTSIPQVAHGMCEMLTGDARFDEKYVVRGEDPWLVRAVMDPGVRRALLAAPTQSVTTHEDRLVSRGATGFEPLDIFARATALRALVKAVPWEAYPNRATIPAQAAVQQIVRERQMRPLEDMPSMPRRA